MSNLTYEKKVYEDYHNERERLNRSLTYLFNRYGLDNPIIAKSGCSFGFEVEYEMETILRVDGKHGNREKEMLTLHRYFEAKTEFVPHPPSYRITELQYKEVDGQYLIECELREIDEYLYSILADDWLMDIINTTEALMLTEELSISLPVNSRAGKRVGKV